MVEQLAAGEHSLRVLEEESQQPQFGGGQRHDLSAATDALPGEVELEVGVTQDIGVVDGHPSAPDGVDAGQDLGDVEWLRQEVVGTEPKSRDTCVDIVDGAEHDDGGGWRCCAQSRHDLDGIDIR